MSDGHLALELHSTPYPGARERAMGSAHARGRWGWRTRERAMGSAHARESGVAEGDDGDLIGAEDIDHRKV